MHCLGGRVLTPELLDTLPPEEAEASLRDLVRINRQWGGHSTLRRLLADCVARGYIEAGKPFSLLDVGAASGDMGQCVSEEYAHARVTSLDYIPSHLALAGDRIAGDAFYLPVAPGSFDIVFCSLFLHHFTNAQVVELLREFGRVARRAVLVIDLERHPIPYYFMRWSSPVLRWDPVTVHDGAISVEAGFRAEELKHLAEQAGLRDVAVRRRWPAFRLPLSGVP
ncbi:MAG: methyltransferase domain-containing protein [Acidobacteriota bacterium]